MAKARYASSRAVPHLRVGFGQRVRAIRRERGQSQEALGERAKLSGKFIGEVERGQKSISIDSAYHVAKALGVPLEALLAVAERKDPVSPEAERIWALCLGKPSAELARLRKVIEAMLRR